MHSDGTSRDHKKYIGCQATLSTGRTLSMGYTTVCTENTDTLLDVAIAVLRELADVYEGGDSIDQNFKELLRKLSGMMSDRASVNKSFNKAIEKKRQEILEDDSLQLQFLYCSAHFLLGLSSESEKVLKKLQKGEKLGRDKMSQFNSWGGSGESAVSRYIRTASDVLGPRGDEKSGCRDAWVAFCSMKEKVSHVQSYRSNRFNNFFQGAASLHFHRADIEDLFSNYNKSPNLKLQSVLADCKCDTINIMLTAVGIIYFTVTGPFWELINSQVKYLDLFRFFAPMREKFQEYSTDASRLISDLSSVIPDFSIDAGDVGVALQNVPDHHQGLLLETLQMLFTGFVSVTDRQLDDFLPGGKYFDVQDADLRNKMNHCRLTNLIGEQNLADLDYSMFAKRHASLHLRSFTNMMSRNKTMTSWFNQKSQAEQKHLLAVSAIKSLPLREKHREKEQMVIAQRAEILAANKRQIEEKRSKVLKRKTALSEQVKNHGGPCLVPRDIDLILKGCSTKGAAKAALTAEIQYQKVVLGAKSKLLKSSKVTNEDMATNLKEFLADPERGKYEPFHDYLCCSLTPYLFTA